MAKGKVQVDLVAKDEASAKIKAVAGHSDDLKKSFLAVATAAAAMATAVTAAVGKMLDDWSSAGDEIAKMAKRTGWAVESLSELDYIAKLSGTDLKSVETATKKLSRSIVDASDGMVTYVREFDRLGLSVDDLMKMGPEEQFWAVAQAIANMEDPTLRSNAALELFGRSGTDLLPIFADGAAGIEEMKEAYKTSYQWTEEATKQAEEFRDALTKLDGVVNNMKGSLVKGLAEPLTELIEDHINPAIERLALFLKENEGIARAFEEFARGLGFVIDQLVKLIETLLKIDAATPDWLAKFSPLSVITGRTGREAGEEYREITGQNYELPGLTPAAVALAGSYMTGAGTIQVTINGNVMGDEAMNRAIAQALEPYLGEAQRTTSFPHVNTSGYYPGSSAR